MPGPPDNTLVYTGHGGTNCHAMSAACRHSPIRAYICSRPTQLRPRAPVSECNLKAEQLSVKRPSFWHYCTAGGYHSAARPPRQPCSNCVGDWTWRGHQRQWQAGFRQRQTASRQPKRTQKIPRNTFSESWQYISECFYFVRCRMARFQQ